MVFFCLCFVHAIAPKLKAFLFSFFKAYAPNKTQDRSPKLIIFSLSLCLHCVCLLVVFVAWLCSFASAFSDLKQIDFLFSLWWW